MGSFVSLLLAPLLQLFALVEPQEQEPRRLSELMELLAHNEEQQQQQDPSVLFARICRRLQQSPEEAACYCHTVDPSPLQQLFDHTPSSIRIPVNVIRSFLDAYEEAAFTSDSQGVTPLLAATKRVSSTLPEEEGEAAVQPEDSSKIVQLLLQANSGAAQQPSKDGRLPLHYVRTNTDVAKNILAAYPAAALHKDQEGRLPLHYYCQLESIRTEREAETQNDDSRIEQQQVLPNPEIAKLLLQAASQSSTSISSAVHKDKKGISPLDLLYQYLQTVLEKNPKQSSTEVELLWEILTLLVHSASPTPTTPLCHALVHLHCPSLVIQEALRRFPQQAVERDAQGRTPLLLAVGLLDNNSPNKNTQAVVCTLLQANRRAARMTDHEGRLAIDVLSEKQNAYDEELYDLIVQAEPRAIDTRDLKNKQHPFLTAAMAGNSNGVYHLLRAKPHVIRYFLNEC